MRIKQSITLQDITRIQLYDIKPMKSHDYIRALVLTDGITGEEFTLNIIGPTKSGLTVRPVIVENKGGSKTV